MFAISRTCQISVFQVLLAVTVLFGIWQRQADALPTESQTFTRRDVPADDISMYTTQVSQILYNSKMIDLQIRRFSSTFFAGTALMTSLQYFLDNYFLTPPPSSCLFYTFQLTAAAQNYSKGGENELTTIWVS